MSVAGGSTLVVRGPAGVLRALIEQARRRARRRRTLALLIVGVLTVVLFLLGHDTPVAGSAGGAKPTVLKTNWSERVDFRYANGSRSGFLRLYVRRIELTRTTWKAAVGITNSSNIPVGFTTGLDQPDPNLPYTYSAAPGIWWSQYVSGGTGWPGAGTVLTHSKPATLVRPAYPSRIGARKSWFATLSGSLAKVPKDRLLRVGYGLFLDPGTFVCTGKGTGCTNARVALSTTHQFRLPRRR